MKRTTRPVLVFRTGSLGDTLVAIPTILAIRASNAEAPLYLLTNESARSDMVSAWDVLKPTGWFEGVLSYHPTAAPRDLLALARSLRHLRFSKAYCLLPLKRNRRQAIRDWFFLRVLAGIPLVRGLNLAAGPQDQLQQREDLRLRQATLGNCTFPGVPNEPPYLVARPEHRQAARSLLGRHGVENAPLVACAPGANMPAKIWPADRYIALCHALGIRHPQLRIVLIGGSKDVDLAARIAASCSNAINLAGKLALWESLALLEECHLYVGNDTGPMHLASVAGVPCIGIFSARAPMGRWSPMGTNHRVLQTKPPCAGCMLESCSEHQLVCLTSISVDDVVNAFQEQWPIAVESHRKRLQTSNWNYGQH